MKKKIIISATLFLTVLVFTKCYYDKADQVYPQPRNCDTTNIRLSVELNSILSANCFACHSGTAESGSGIQLDQYAVIKTYADNGQLMSAITQDGKVSPMPKNASRLSDCDINKFAAWINNGAPGN